MSLFLPVVAAAASSPEAPAAAHGGGEAHGPAQLLMHHVSDAHLLDLHLGPVTVAITKHVVFIVVAATAVLIL